MVFSRTNLTLRHHRRAPRFLVLLVTLYVWLTVVFSASADIQFDVFLGYDGYVPDFCWFPVMIEVKNDGAPFVGHIQIQNSAVKRTIVRHATVELPTGTLKRIFIPVFGSSWFRNSWDIQLVDENGRIRKESLNLSARKQVAVGVPLMGALPRSTLGLPEMAKIKNSDSALQPVVARLLPNNFPDNPIELEGLKSIYLNSEQAANLNAAQIDALYYWLEQGGHLIVAVEEINDVNSSPWLRKLVPMELHGIKTVSSHSEIHDWLVHPLEKEKPNALRYRLKQKLGEQITNPYAEILLDSSFEHSDLRIVMGDLKKCAVILSASGNPLILESDQGNGTVTTLLFSPERKPFGDWKSLPWFWAKISEVPNALYLGNMNENNYGASSSDGIVGAMIDSRQVRKLPIGWLLMLLITYLLVIGPFDRYWLKKIRRPMLTWITFPCYVVGFSLLIYFIGYRLRAGESEWNELHVVDVLPRGQGAEIKGHSYMSIYSPINNEYVVANPQKFSSFRGEFQGGYSSGQDGDSADVLQTGESFKANVSVPVWTSQLFESEWWQSAEMPVSFTASKSGEDWVFNVSNPQDRELQNLSIFVADKMFDLGPMPAKQQKEFRSNASQGIGIDSVLAKIAGEINGSVQSRRNAFGSTGRSHIDDVLGGLRAMTFLSQMPDERFMVPPGIDLSALVGNDRALMLAWETNYSPVQPLNNFSPRRRAQNTLWRLSTSVDAPSTKSK